MESIREKLCGMNIHYVRHEFGRFLADMQALGLSQIELWAGMPHLCVEDADAAFLADLRARIADRGMTVTCVTPEQCVYPINLASDRAATRERSVRYFLRCLEICDTLEAGQLLVTPGWDYAGADPTVGWKRSRDALGRIAERAGELGLEILLEPLSHTETNLLTTSGDLRRMIDEIGSTAVSAILDLNAMAAAGERVADYTGTFGQRLRHVHLCDGTPEGHLAWGDGNLPLADHANELRAEGYRGTYAFEFTTQAYWLDPLPPLARSIRAFEAAIAAGEA